MHIAGSARGPAPATGMYECLEILSRSNASISEMMAPITLLTFVDIFILIGNGFVIAAVLGFRRLRTVNCYFIVSLAVADTSLAVFVLPFSTVFESVNQIWIFGKDWCQIWLMVDVFLCTASIYNLVAISIDRYVAIKRPLNYPSIVTHRKGALGILTVWAAAFLVCFPPAFTWRNTDTITAAANKSCTCSPMNNSPGYIIFSSIASFYLPMIVIFFVYIEIFKIAHQSASHQLSGVMTVRSNAKSQKISTSNNTDSNEIESKPFIAETQTLRVHVRRKDATPESKLREFRSKLRRRSDGFLFFDKRAVQRTAKEMPHMALSSMIAAPLIEGDKFTPTSPVIRSTSVSRMSAIITKAKRNQNNRYFVELRAVKTVAIVTGCFVCCWLGFAVCYTLQALPSCRDGSCLDKRIFGVVFWLGYINSAINPIIYALFNREFRTAFRLLLRCRIKNTSLHGQRGAYFRPASRQ